MRPGGTTPPPADGKKSGGVFAAVADLHIGELGVLGAIGFANNRNGVAEVEAGFSWFAHWPAAGRHARDRRGCDRREPAWRGRFGFRRYGGQRHRGCPTALGTRRQGGERRPGDAGGRGRGPGGALAAANG